MKKKYLIPLVILMFLYSCGQFKKIVYLQPTKLEENDTLYKYQRLNYHIQPADLIYVNVKSMDKDVDELFSNTSSSATTQSSMTGNGNFYIKSYSVDKDGFIKLPVIGNVLVGGLNIEEARKLLQERAEVYLKNPTVDVKLVSFKVSVLGEVKVPGVVTVYNDQANIFELIAQAGDITYYGNHKNVLLLRSTREGTLTYRIDLTKRDLLTSDKYFLQPNDIIYVEPFRSTIVRTRINDYVPVISVVTSATTLILLFYNVFK
jgi:polysaccharide export outer membrane protein